MQVGQSAQPAPFYSMKNLFEGLEGTHGVPYSEDNFFDAKFMSAREKIKVFKNFKNVIKNRDISKMSETLYKHLHLHCGFIAHFNRLGFKDRFSGQNFRDFIEHFDQNSSDFKGWGHIWSNDSDYCDINGAMVALVTEAAPRIYQELDNEKAHSEVSYVKTLATKHGLKISE